MDAFEARSQHEGQISVKTLLWLLSKYTLFDWHIQHNVSLRNGSRPLTYVQGNAANTRRRQPSGEVPQVKLAPLTSNRASKVIKDAAVSGKAGKEKGDAAVVASNGKDKKQSINSSSFPSVTGSLSPSALPLAVAVSVPYVLDISASVCLVSCVFTMHFCLPDACMLHSLCPLPHLTYDPCPYASCCIFPLSCALS